MRRFFSISFCISQVVIGALLLAITAKGAESKKFTFMTYNLENLFDTEHDEGKEDFTYLPIAKKQSADHKAFCATIKNKWWRNDCQYLDWSTSILNKKMSQLAQVVLSVNDGKGPDVAVFQEVENIKVLKEFNSKYLTAAGYKTVALEEGPDTRGIDVGIVSRFELIGKPKLHIVPLQLQTGAKYVTRGIIEVNLALPNKETLTVFGVHFPSGRNPYFLREEAFKYLTKIAKEKNSNLVVAAGDFNVNAREDSRIYRNIGSESWYISHINGCHSCLGSNYYTRNNSWSFLDAIMQLKPTSTKGKTQWQMNFDSVSIVNQNTIQKDDRGFPKRFEIKTLDGVSDHFPLKVEFENSSESKISLRSK